MIYQTSQILFFLEALIFATVIFMHLSKKGSSVVFLYVVQSLVIAGLLFSSAWKNSSLMLMLVAFLVFAIKVVIAPHFFRKLIKKHQLKFASSTYLNGPLTLIILAVLTGFTYSHFFQPLTILSRDNVNALLLSVAMMLISILLVINRKGALSQMIGILSLENAIVSFAFLSGLEQMPGLQLGIIFDISIWLVISTVFAEMIYDKFGTLNVTKMEHLKEE